MTLRHFVIFDNCTTMAETKRSHHSDTQLTQTNYRWRCEQYCLYQFGMPLDNACPAFWFMISNFVTCTPAPMVFNPSCTYVTNFMVCYTSFRRFSKCVSRNITTIEAPKTHYNRLFFLFFCEILKRHLCLLLDASHVHFTKFLVNQYKFL